MESLQHWLQWCFMGFFRRKKQTQLSKPKSSSVTHCQEQQMFWLHGIRHSQTMLRYTNICSVCVCLSVALCGGYQPHRNPGVGNCTAKPPTAAQPDPEGEKCAINISIKGDGLLQMTYSLTKSQNYYGWKALPSPSNPTRDNPHLANQPSVPVLWLSENWAQITQSDGLTWDPFWHLFPL